MRLQFFGLLCLAIALAGCPRDVTLRGDRNDANGNPLPSVVDISGHGLPGVAVSIYGTERQAVTDARGQFRLSAPMGSLQLDYIKTGYTPARVIIETADRSSIDVPQAVMWPLPESQGIFAFENNRYRSLTRVEPQRYLAGETQSVFASKKGPEAFVDPQNMPKLILYRLPGYDLQLCKLHQRELTPADAGPSAKGYTVPVWAVEQKLPMHSQPIDSPQALLTEVVPDVTLAPGEYAIHWGAFDGFSSTEARGYLFKVMGAEAPEAAEEAEEEKVETKKEKEKGKDRGKESEKSKEKKPSRDKRDTEGNEPADAAVG